MSSLRLLWASQLVGQGIVYGYSSFANNMKGALMAAGVEIVEKIDEPFDIAVHFVTPTHFRPISGVRNLIFTMFECTTLPESWVAPINAADIIVVPCKNNRDLFRNYTTKPVEICPLGFDPTLFTYKARTEPKRDEAFRFLWVGAPSIRKGLLLLTRLWVATLRQGKLPINWELIMKTSDAEQGEQVVKYKLGMNMTEGEEGKGVIDFCDSRSLPPEAPDLPGITIDTRNYFDQELIDLYHSAHALILPSLGEGWGLTLCEGMATGLPCIWTHWGGPRDFADETIGYPLNKYWFNPLDVILKVDKKGNVIKHHTAVVPDPKEILHHMMRIYENYPLALEKGRRASERMHGQYTWAQAAARFVEICEKFA